MAGRYVHNPLLGQPADLAAAAGLPVLGAFGVAEPLVEEPLVEEADDDEPASPDLALALVDSLAATLPESVDVEAAASDFSDFSGFSPPAAAPVRESVR